MFGGFSADIIQFNCQFSKVFPQFSLDKQSWMMTTTMKDGDTNHDIMQQSILAPFFSFEELYDMSLGGPCQDLQLIFLLYNEYGWMKIFCCWKRWVLEEDVCWMLKRKSFLHYWQVHSAFLTWVKMPIKWGFSTNIYFPLFFPSNAF